MIAKNGDCEKVEDWLWFRLRLSFQLLVCFPMTCEYYLLSRKVCLVSAQIYVGDGITFWIV